MPQSALEHYLPILVRHRRRLEKNSIAELFKADPARAAQFSVEDDNLLFDYSKNHLDKDALAALIELASDADITKARDDMFTGKKINVTENRAVLHTALRSNDARPLIVDGEDIRLQIAEAKKRLFEFAESVRNGEYKMNGNTVRDVVNIGIGGSDLGPQMCHGALSKFHSGPNVHFVSNLDSADFTTTAKNLDPATTLFIIASKSFTTTETMTNARLAKDWLGNKLKPAAIAEHFVALSTNLPEVKNFGIAKEHTFGFQDWVGGRFSIWSAIGLSLVIAIGKQNFQHFLDGAYSADRHFQTRKLEENIPVLLALLTIWHRNVWNFPTRAVLPYDNNMARFPAYLQQLEMESNGKHICRDGTVSKFPTAPVVWGEPGTDGQHAFYQLLHQGTDIIPCDFFVAAASLSNTELENKSHRMLVANCFAQSEALMRGRSLDEALAPHKVFDGNRPSNTFLYRQLTPHMLGHLIAIFEHKVFVEGVIWGINSFDQWGVELGKSMAGDILPLLNDPAVSLQKYSHNASTKQLVEKFHHFAKKQK